MQLTNNWGIYFFHFFFYFTFFCAKIAVFEMKIKKIHCGVRSIVYRNCTQIHITWHIMHGVGHYRRLGKYSSRHYTPANKPKHKHTKSRQQRLTMQLHHATQNPIRHFMCPLTEEGKLRTKINLIQKHMFTAWMPKNMKTKTKIRKDCK